MIHKSTPPMFPISPLTKSDKTINRFQYYRISTKKPIPTKRISLTIITHQLTVRKFLQNRLCSISDVMCFLGLLILIIKTPSISVSPSSYIDIDVALGLPIRDAPLKSFDSLNQVSINFTFLTKIYVEKWPIRCLSIICILIFFIGSWSIRACDYQHAAKHISMVDSMWLFIVTYTTVGYGDLASSTYCGRTVFSITALIGVLVTALLIFVVTKY
ncbi:unnamed protein product [Rotaria sordida]|uniref:Potassium channel domain-containing protein n=1 Tax=Rotaria sordida TaxID=392033 RepID=A0A819TA09_9BILA|nr:unnamed protein product [Rotaria sordida]